MIDSAYSYIRDEIAPRYHRVLFTTHPWLSAVISLTLTNGVPEFHKDVKLSALVFYISTYSSLAIGFCVTGMTVCFALSERYIKFLSKSKDITGKDALDDLIFVFSWTAIINVIEISYSIFLYMFVGDVTLKVWISQNFKISAFFLLFIVIYSFLQFFVAVITVSQSVLMYKIMINKNK